MTIELLTLTPPVIVSKSKPICDQIKDVISERRGQIVPLPPGTHDITPKESCPPNQHQLLVYPTGIGFYRTQSLYVATVILSEEKKLQYGTRTQSLIGHPAVILEQRKENLIFSRIAFYHDGPSPIDNRS